MESGFPFIAALLASMIHVVTGPDHLAAVTTFAIDAKKKAWKIGLMWSFGHLLGMILIGGLFLLFKSFIPVEAISEYSEKLVGLVLIIIGIWVFIKIFRSNKTHQHLHVHSESNPMIHSHEHLHNNNEGHSHEHSKEGSQKNSTALWIGVLHGFAGIAHFILFLPVVSFDSTFDSVSYLVGFALGIIIAMVVFTLLIGNIAAMSHDKHDESLFRGLRISAGLFAIVIGCYWLFWL